MSSTEWSSTDDDEDYADQFGNLPDVILLKIFSFLNVGDLCKAGRVCLHWYDLTRSPILWKYVDAHDLQLTSRQVQKFIPILPACVRYLRIKSLSIQHRIPFLTPQGAIEIRERCPLLKTLIIESAFVAKHVHFTDITVEDLPQKLSVLSLRKSFFHADQFFCSISHPTVPKIKVLDCTSCWCIKDYDIPFFTRLSDLQELYLTDCPITDFGISVLLKMKDSFKVLDLEATHITDTSVSLISERCRLLEKLFLARTRITDLPWNFLPHNTLTKLSDLCLANSQVTIVGIRSLLLTLHNLKYLNARIRSITSDNVLELSCLIPVKRNLYIEYYPSMLDFTNPEYCDHFLERINIKANN